MIDEHLRIHRRDESSSAGGIVAELEIAVAQDVRRVAGGGAGVDDGDATPPGP